MNPIKIIKKSIRPLYEQAIDAVNDLIIHGKYQSGDRLPPESELAEQLGISRSTLREAVGYLESRGVVFRKHGVGIFVAHPAQTTPQRGLDEVESLISLANKIGVEYHRVLWQVSTLPATTIIAEKLSIDSSESVVRVEMVVKLDGKPYAYMDGIIKSELVDVAELTDYANGSFLDYLFEKGQFHVSHTYSRVAAVTCSQPIARRMGLPVDTPLLHLEETYQSQDGTPLVWTQNYFDSQVLNFFIVRRIVRD